MKKSKDHLPELRGAMISEVWVKRRRRARDITMITDALGIQTINVWNEDGTQNSTTDENLTAHRVVGPCVQRDVPGSAPKTPKK